MSTLLCNQATATLEWHKWIEARHCQLIINTLSANCLHSSLFLCVCVGGLLLCVVRKLWDDFKLKDASMLTFLVCRLQLPEEICTKPHGEVKELLISRHQSGTFYPLLVVVCLWEITCCLSQVQTSTWVSETGFLLLSISVTQTSPFIFFKRFLFHMLPGSAWE